MDFIKKLSVCDIYFISPEDLINYEYLVQEATREYRIFIYSKRWEPATSNKNSQEQLSLLKA